MTHTLVKKYLWRGVICGSLICYLLSSCRSTKDITYFQPASPEVDEITAKIEEAYTPVIKPGDILSITVKGLDAEANMFNPLQQDNYSGQNVGIITPRPITGFTVDPEGNITLPLVGDVHVAGLTSKATETILAKQLMLYIQSPTVTVRIANYMISVLGEVARPAMYNIPNERITLPEVIALAGDMTIYGKRKNILIIRETDGNRQFARVDITKRDVFNSPYYYLRSGDVVYVEATSGRLTSTDRAYQLTPIVISSLSFMIMALTLLL
jgi:polysaccharide export outer membrane protein